MRVTLLVLVGTALVGSVWFTTRSTPSAQTQYPAQTRSDPPRLYSHPLTPSQKLIVAEAKSQLTNPATYAGAYYSISYPNGDPPANRGACTDVVIRALRHANIDLQKLIHEDSKIASYSRILRPDTNIDHRRCPNQIRFLTRHGKKLTNNLKQKNQWQPGDIVFWKLPNNLDHVGILSDELTQKGHPLVIHNIGPSVAQEDVLHSWKIVGHFRYPIDQAQ